MVAVAPDRQRTGDLRLGDTALTIHFIGAGPGAADLITLRGARLLATCPVCLYAGSIVPLAMLDHCAPGTRLIDTAPLSLDDIEAKCVAVHAAGSDATRLHSGDLALYSAVAEQLRRLDRRGIPYTLTPGVPAFAAAAAAIGRELTVPGLVQTVVLTRVSGRASAMPPREQLSAYAATGATLAIHLAAAHLPPTLAALVPHYGPHCPAALVVHASWPDQRIIRATLATLAAPDVERTAMLLVGPALDPAEFSESALYSPDYQRRYRPQP